MLIVTKITVHKSRKNTIQTTIPYIQTYIPIIECVLVQLQIVSIQHRTAHIGITASTAAPGAGAEDDCVKWKSINEGKTMYECMINPEQIKASAFTNYQPISAEWQKEH